MSQNGGMIREKCIAIGYKEKLFLAKNYFLELRNTMVMNRLIILQLSDEGC